MTNTHESSKLFYENSQNVIETNLSIDDLKVPVNLNQITNMNQNNLVSSYYPYDTYYQIKEINCNYPSYNNISPSNNYNPFLRGIPYINKKFTNPHNYIRNNYSNQIPSKNNEEEENNNPNIENMMENLDLKNFPFINGNKDQKNHQPSPNKDSTLIKRQINAGNNQIRYDFFQGQTINQFNPNNCREYNRYTHRKVKSSFLLAYNFTGNILDEQILMSYFRPTYNVQLKSFDYNAKLINPKEIEEKRLKEIKRIEKIKLNMFERRKQNRKNLDKRDQNTKINETLEDMCIYGNLLKRQLEEEKKLNPNKFIELNEALNLKEKNEGLFALGLFSANLNTMGIKTEIEKEEIKKDCIVKDDGNEEAITCLDFITNGLANRKKYDLYFDFGERRNEELLYNEDKYKIFLEKIKLKISRDYKVPTDKIILTFPQKGSFHIQLIFQSEEFNELDTEEFKAKFRNDHEFRDLCYLKEIHSDIIMGACKLTKKQLDSKGNRSSGWPKGERRGKKPYYSPEGWIGIGLKVEGKYENDDWLGMKNKDGEWCVAYHGVGYGQNSDKVKGISGLIYKAGFKPGRRQAHKDCDDQFHPGKKVGEGVYCTDKIEVAEKYAGTVEINGKKYKMVIMSRVRPDKIRHCDTCLDSKEPFNYWVINGTTGDIRPYRLLYKRV